MVEFLLKNRANVNITDNYGQTALHKLNRHSVFNSSKETIANLLISHEADINWPDIYKQSPLHIAMRDGNFHTQIAC